MLSSIVRVCKKRGRIANSNAFLAQMMTTAPVRSVSDEHEINLFRDLHFERCALSPASVTMRTGKQRQPTGQPVTRAAGRTARIPAVCRGGGCHRRPTRTDYGMLPKRSKNGQCFTAPVPAIELFRAASHELALEAAASSTNKFVFLPSSNSEASERDGNRCVLVCVCAEH